MTRLAVDAMGGDNAPQAVIDGCILASREMDVDLVLVGPEERLLPVLGGGSRLQVENATEVIGVDEHPVQAFRRKKDSTIRAGLNLVRDGHADAFVSAGSTGALLAGGLLTLGRIPGVDRPGLCLVIPDIKKKPFVLVDVGANTDVRAENLRQFAIMGSIYAERVLGITRPRIALINIGVEESKGSQLVKDAYQLMGSAGLNFVGNVEARDVFLGKADVLVADGFTGNVLLKTIEGVAETLFHLLKQELVTDLRAKVGALLVKPYLKRVVARMDYAEYGGAPLLGLAAPCIKCHGSSDARAIYSGIGVAKRFVDTGVVKLIREAVESQESAE